jgi:hypothetical protein
LSKPERDFNSPRNWQENEKMLARIFCGLEEKIRKWSEGDIIYFLYFCCFSVNFPKITQSGLEEELFKVFRPRNWKNETFQNWDLGVKIQIPCFFKILLCKF